MLIGDAADNIKGVVGIGEKKAKAAIDPLTDEKDMHDLVLSLYSDKERFNLNAQLLWILKHERNPQESLLHFQSLHKQGQATEQSSSPFLESSHDHGLGATPQITSPSHQ
jgi:5'-3' exonuclease